MSAENPEANRKALQDLIESRTAILKLEGFFSPNRLKSLHERIGAKKSLAQVTGYVNGSLTTFGPYLAKHLADLSRYFEQAGEIYRIFGEDFELDREVRSKIGHHFGLEKIEPAFDIQHGPYAPCTIRIHGNRVANPLHNDNIKRDGANSGLTVAGLTHQLSCVVCIQECTSGGELKHYQKQWEPADERYKIPAGLGYEPQVVDGYPSITFRPREGDVYLINPMNYHEILPTYGKDRITMGFFFGFTDPELRQAIAWS
ncbi:2OG-Fe(II)-dependent halogenase WelO5 family protein [Azospirillum canadense]|uniref:2OG-Fe(II)-dependent halogenase WelO5 family protein n=1 Tax=Azospirillum canadense TaxID=403962 RepID=UPI002226274F|nr:hypothetical protein [Azospirillum canadense]MCW2239653.1 hypothetical protein [Azospirillum canadense]